MELSFKNKMSSLNTSENLVIFWPETAVFNINHFNSFPIFKPARSFFNNLTKFSADLILVVSKARNTLLNFFLDKILDYLGFNFLNKILPILNFG